MQYGKTDCYDLYFFYDDNDQPLGFYYTDVFTSGRGRKFYFVLNAQGDVVQLRDSQNRTVANYHYDAWGKLLSITDADGTVLTAASDDYYPTNAQIAFINPIRYRGYVYDNETGFYYLNTRYYDPSLRRFISADGQISGTDGEILGYNQFAYCFNNPVNMDDSNGNWPKWAKKLVAAAAVVAVVAVVAAVTVATAGAGTAIAAVAVGAAKGAAIGMVSGAIMGAAAGAVKHRASTGSWKGAGEAVLNGMGDGALSGAVSGAVTGGISGGINYANQVTSADPVKAALEQLDSSGVRPGQTEIKRGKVMELVNNFDSIKAQSAIYSDGTTRYIVDGHHTTVASTILGKGTCMNMGMVTSQLPSATNVYWAKKWYEFGKTVIKIVD